MKRYLISLLLFCGLLHASELKDASGRVVKTQSDLSGGIVTIGSSGPLRFLSIFDLFSHIKEVDRGDVTDQKNGRAYSYAYPYDKFTPDMYHPDTKLEGETLEKIGAKKPSLIIVQQSVYENYKENCDILAKSFNLVVLPNQSMTKLWEDDFTLASWYTHTVNIIAKATGKADRAKEHINAVNAIIKDIRLHVKQSDKKVFVAGLTWQGSNELTTTFPTYLPLMLAGGTNAHGGSELSRVVMDPEAMTKLHIDMVLIDPSSSDKLKTPNSQLILEWLRAQNTPLHVTIPMVWDSANYDCVLAGAYYIVHLLYGSLTLEEVRAKTKAVFEAYYGAHGSQVLEKMELFFKEKSSSNGFVLPLLSDVKVIKTPTHLSTH